MSQLRHARSVATVAGVAAVYFLAARFGLSLAFVNASASPVWPPTGIALAAILLFGFRAWPGVWLGALLANLATTGSIGPSIGIATGNTLECVVGAWLVRRFASGQHLFDRPRDVFTFAALAGLFGTGISATIGVSSLALGGLARWPDFGTTWLTWWLGDAAGAIIVAPFLILWGQSTRDSWSWRRAPEAGLLLCSLIVVGVLVLARGGPAAGAVRPLNFLCFPLLIWAAFRFTQLGASTAVVVLSAIAIWGFSGAIAFLPEHDLNESLLILQTFMAVASVSSLALGASVSLRRRIEASLRLTTEGLEQMVIERTGRLWAANKELHRESSERARAVEQLEKTDARLREAQQVARIGSWEWDIERDVVWWSDELYATFGLEREDFRATLAGFLERVHTDDRDRVHRVIGMAVQNKEPFSFEHRVIRPDGQTATLHGRGRVLTDETGVPTRMLGTAQDVSEHKRTDEERERLMREQAARREAEEANRLKDEFLAVLSHELRNPLNAIVVWAELLKVGRLDRARRARGIDVIQRSAELQSQLILDLLDLSRITSGRLELRRQTVDLATVTMAAVDSLRPTAQARDVRMLARMNGVGPHAIGDPERLQQVLWNLLSNAIRFAPEGGRVRVTLQASDVDVRIRVDDNGPGIDPQMLPHLFDRFRRGSPLPTRRHDGLGLGLTIVKHLVELHGGSISATNAEGSGGAIFTVTLPLAHPPATRGLANGAAAGNGQTAQSLRDVRILVVDDDENSREPLRLLLTCRGAEVEAAESSAQAMALLEARPPDVLISDIAMPESDGYELLARVRALPSERGGDVPAIALTAYAGAEDARKAIDAGFHTHVAKPFDSRDLVRIIEELVHGVRA